MTIIREIIEKIKQYKLEILVVFVIMWLACIVCWFYETDTKDFSGNYSILNNYAGYTIVEKVSGINRYGTIIHSIVVEKYGDYKTIRNVDNQTYYSLDVGDSL